MALSIVLTCLAIESIGSIIFHVVNTPEKIGYNFVVVVVAPVYISSCHTAMI
jgi:hypothetical protein